jgi:hypothetical protein
VLVVLEQFNLQEAQEQQVLLELQCLLQEAVEVQYMAL